MIWIEETSSEQVSMVFDGSYAQHPDSTLALGIKPSNDDAAGTATSDVAFLDAFVQLRDGAAKHLFRYMTGSTPALRLRR